MSLCGTFQKMTPPEAEKFKLFQPIYSQGCSLTIANRFPYRKIFIPFLDVSENDLAGV